jgi:hypothetical protein
MEIKKQIILSNFEVVLRYGENTVCTTENKSLRKLYGPKMGEEF